MTICKNVAGPDLPTTCSEGKMITSPAGDGVIFLGSKCEGDGYNYNTFFQLKVDQEGSYKWITMNQTLKYQRWTPILAYVDDSKISCNSNSTTQTIENPSTTTITTSSTTSTTTTSTTTTTTTTTKSTTTATVISTPVSTTDLPGTTFDPRKGIYL